MSTELPIATATAVAMPTMPVATATATATPMPTATASVAPMPVAAAVPVQPVASAPVPYARAQSFGGAVAQFNRKPLWVRATSAGCCFLFLLLGGFMFVRTLIMGCGCPSGYEYSTGSDSSRCDCDGDVFTCSYQCYDGRCFQDGDEVSCDNEYSNSTSNDGSTGQITCPGATSYCDCDGDCGSTYCECDEAMASACCGSGR